MRDERELVDRRVSRAAQKKIRCIYAKVCGVATRRPTVLMSARPNEREQDMIDTVCTRELSVGDVVLKSGMRIRVTSAPTKTLHPRNEGGDTYAARGVIENADELRDESGSYRYPFTGLIDNDLSWTLQGNDWNRYVLAERD